MSITTESPGRNPLGIAQRETAGAQTFEKYEYQYHWALCRILGAHEDSDDYVVFIELHEDVVLATSSDETIAKFEFSQIKDVSGTKWHAKKLTSVPKARGAIAKNSILGKMLQGVSGKPFFSKLTSLDLVATCGFNLLHKIEGLNLSIIAIDDIHTDCLNVIQAAIKKELGEDVALPKVLRFITPDMPTHGFQDVAVGRIARLVEKTAPGTNCNAATIYRVLIDDLHKKGGITYDFIEWSDLIKHKGITHRDVERTISSYTENRGIVDFEVDFSEILVDLGIRLQNRILIRRCFERYHNAVRLNRTLIAMDNQQVIKGVVLQCFQTFEEEGVKAFMDRAIALVPESTKINLLDLDAIQAAIIYELLCKCYDK